MTEINHHFQLSHSPVFVLTHSDLHSSTYINSLSFPPSLRVQFVVGINQHHSSVGYCTVLWCVIKTVLQSRII